MQYSSILPPFLADADEVLVPIKVDITHKGARFVDSFTWNIKNSMLSPEEFALRTCLDLNLPDAFKWKIALQIQEQCEAYCSFIDVVSFLIQESCAFLSKMHELQHIAIGIRHDIVDYSDKFTWDMYSKSNSPEVFARVTCADLGLPSEMEPAIAHRIRETLIRCEIFYICSPCNPQIYQFIRNILTWVEDPSSLTTTPPSQSAVVSETKVVLVPPHQVVDMVTNLWKRAKPTSIDEQAAVPQPRLPKDKDSNAFVWTGGAR